MDTYQKVFFWIFIIFGILYGIQNQNLIDNYLAELKSFADNLLDSRPFLMDLTKGSDSIIQMILKLILFIILALITLILFVLFMLVYHILLGLFFVLNKVYLSYALVGMIFIYPFYFIFINLFELFLLVMIQHPSKREIRRVIGRRKIDNQTIDRLSQQMMTSAGKIPHTVESQIMTQQLKGLSRLIHAEIAAIRKLRELRIRQGLARAN